MKRLLIGGLAVGSLLFAASGVASANTVAIPLAKPTPVALNKLTTTSRVAGGSVGTSSWPLSDAPGKLVVSFATPAPTQQISGYAVTCKAPTKDALGVLLPAPLPNMVATFAVDPATGLSADVDYANTAGTTTLQVGPYGVFQNNVLPPLVCTIVATNAAGASAAGPGNLPTAPSPGGTCDDGSGTGAPGLLTVLGGGSLAPLLGQNGTEPQSNNLPPVLPHPTATNLTFPLGAQTSTNHDIVIADLSGFGGPSAVPFCSTNDRYEPHLLSDQSVSFSPSVSAIPAVTLPVSLAHPAQAKLSAFGLTAAVKSTATLTVASSSTIYAYDSAHFHIDACASLALCLTDTPTIIAGSGGLLTAQPGVGYIAVIDTVSKTVLPGKPIVGAPITLTVSKNVFTQVAAVACNRLVGPASAGCLPTTTVAGAYPAAMGIVFGGAKTSIAVGAAPPVPVQVAGPGSVIKALTLGATDGGDLNYTAPVAAIVSALF